MTETLQTERLIFSVSEITANIRVLLEENFSGIWVEGEVSGSKLHNSGHRYFSLKDGFAQLQCVMFRRENGALKFDLEEGMKILAYGRVSVYPVRGQYQLYVERIEPRGVGELGLRFEQLKEKLKKEGLFDEARKRPLPFLPHRIGVVTSIDGAALHDILHVLDRRFPDVHILLYPVPVQGHGAAERIAQAIDDLNRENAADVLIVGRGGGSLEDLWAFNEEIVARAIFGSAIPVISAVGHEIDFTIADFVADVRAATPSAAAEIVLPEKEAIEVRVEELRERATCAIATCLDSLKQELKSLKQSRALKDPLSFFEISFQRVDELKKHLASSFERFFLVEKERLSSLLGKLEALGPLSTLKRGFSVSLKMPSEEIITDANRLKVGDLVKTRLRKGSFISRVHEIHS